jgi:DNA-binding transcriptional regulator YhcF (GntR family)
VSFDLDGDGPLFEQLARNLKSSILEGRYPSGAFLPATRALATTLGISGNTVLSAYELLCAERLAVAKPRSGTRIANTPPTHTRTARSQCLPSPDLAPVSEHSYTPNQPVHHQRRHTTFKAAPLA